MSTSADATRQVAFGRRVLEFAALPDDTRMINVAWDWADDDETPSCYLAQLVDALWRHQNAANWSTLDNVRWACLAVSGDAAARADLDTNPAWRLP